jgi:hypothetical protein
MHDPIPASSEEIFALRSQPVDKEMIVVAISAVVKLARSQGQSLDELTAEVLQDDSMLDLVQRRCLSNLVEQAWQVLP